MGGSRMRPKYRHINLTLPLALLLVSIPCTGHQKKKSIDGVHVGWVPHPNILVAANFQIFFSSFQKAEANCSAVSQPLERILTQGLLVLQYSARALHSLASRAANHVLGQVPRTYLSYTAWLEALRLSLASVNDSHRKILRLPITRTF
ncbi:hypothetical protein BKA83DRAFT_2485767 [Pisolithus microcarpus]|nr:hypothetical protein BKA83DRAFT_2485767 [Pisolithus microcarpus]